MVLERAIKRKWLKAHPVRDSRRKSLLKAISWRAVGTLDTILLSWLITGELMVAASIGILELVTKTILYYVHERVWSQIDVTPYQEIEKLRGSRINNTAGDGI